MSFFNAYLSDGKRPAEVVQTAQYRPPPSFKGGAPPPRHHHGQHHHHVSKNSKMKGPGNKPPRGNEPVSRKHGGINLVTLVIIDNLLGVLADFDRLLQMPRELCCSFCLQLLLRKGHKRESGQKNQILMCALSVRGAVFHKFSKVSKFSTFSRVTPAAILHTLTEQLPTTAIWMPLTKSTSSSFYLSRKKCNLIIYYATAVSVFV